MSSDLCGINITLNQNTEVLSITTKKKLLKTSKKHAIPKTIPQKITSLHFGFL